MGKITKFFLQFAPPFGLIFAIITGVGCRYPEGESPDALRWRGAVLQALDGKTGA